MNLSMGSLTLWQRLMEAPRDPILWPAFHRRYQEVVFGWAWEWARDKQLAEEDFSLVMSAMFPSRANLPRPRFL